VASLPVNLRADIGDAVADREQIRVDLPDHGHANASLKMPPTPWMTLVSRSSVRRTDGVSRSWTTPRRRPAAPSGGA
jgi:hypothetical protein